MVKEAGWAFWAVYSVPPSVGAMIVRDLLARQHVVVTAKGGGIVDENEIGTLGTMMAMNWKLAARQSSMEPETGEKIITGRGEGGEVTTDLMMSFPYLTTNDLDGYVLFTLA